MKRPTKKAVKESIEVTEFLKKSIADLMVDETTIETGIVKRHKKQHTKESMLESFKVMTSYTPKEKIDDILATCEKIANEVLSKPNGLPKKPTPMDIERAKETRGEAEQLLNNVSCVRICIKEKQPVIAMSYVFKCGLAVERLKHVRPNERKVVNDDIRTRTLIKQSENRSHSDTFKNNALTIFNEARKTMDVRAALTHAQKKTDIPATTIKNWVYPRSK